MFKAVLFILLHKILETSQMSFNGWMAEQTWHINTMEYTTQWFKEINYWYMQQHQKDLKSTILSEKSWYQRATYYIIPFI